MTSDPAVTHQGWTGFFTAAKRSWTRKLERHGYHLYQRARRGPRHSQPCQSARVSYLLSVLSFFFYASPPMCTVAAQTPSSRPVISHESLLIDYAKADLILRSRDSYEFRVLKLFIVHNSPILEEKVLVSQNAQPPSTIPAEHDVDSEHAADAFQLPVVQFPIDGATLFSLLTYIFPIPLVLPPTVEQVMELLSVAQMYKMDTVLTHIRNHIAQQEPPFIREETAFHVYFLSQKHGLQNEALQAARCTLSFATLTIDNLAKENKLDVMPGPFLHELWKYHRRVRSNLKIDLREFKKSIVLTRPANSWCDSFSDSPTDSGLPDWLDAYISEIGANDAPFSLDLSKFHKRITIHVQGRRLGCSNCAHKPQKDICAFWGTLTAVVHNSIVKVRVNYISALPNGPQRFKRLSQISHAQLRGRGLEASLRPDKLTEPPFYGNIQTCLTQMSSSNHPTSSISMSIHRC